MCYYVVLSAADVVFQDFRDGERNAIEGWRWRALVLLRDRVEVGVAGEEVAFLDPVP